MYMYRHLIESEISKSCFEFYVVALKVVGTEITVIIRSKRFPCVRLNIKGNSVNDILKQIPFIAGYK